MRYAVQFMQLFYSIYIHIVIDFSMEFIVNQHVKLFIFECMYLTMKMYFIKSFNNFLAGTTIMTVAVITKILSSCKPERTV